MGSEDIWFGNTEAFALLKAPARIAVTRAGYFESMGFENGFGDAARSSTFQQRFEFTYPWDESTDSVTAEILGEYAAGEYGAGLVRFADPMAYDVNLFPPHWASPRLVELEWPNIGTTTPTFAVTAGNSYRQPSRKGTWSVTTAANATPLTDATIPYVIIPIHPSYTLQIGATGAATGTAVVRVESWVNGATSAAASTSLTLLSETGATRMNATVAGGTYAYAKVFLTRTSSAVSTITPISMMAQLTLTGSSPVLPERHKRGKGHTGLMFEGHPDEEYLDASDGRHYKAITASFLEVGGKR